MTASFSTRRSPTFPHRLRERMAHESMTQEQLASAIGRTQPTISLWMSSKRLPQADDLCALASLFDVSVDYLLGRDGEPMPDVERLGHARVRIYDCMEALRGAVGIADVQTSAPRFKRAMRLNDLAHHLSVAVKDYGRILPETAPQDTGEHHG